MSFSFQAAGHRAEVIGSLRNTQTYGNQLGTRVRDAIISALEEDEGKNAGAGGQMAYVVKAFGHSGGHGTAYAQLTATVESFYQAIPEHADENPPETETPAKGDFADIDGI